MRPEPSDATPPVDLVPATGPSVEWVRSLLEGTGLPTADLSSPGSDGGPKGDDPALYAVRAETGRVGCIGVERYGDDGLLRSAVIQERYRGKGYGRAAVRALETEVRENGVEALYLLTTTAPEFFAALGYERVERSAVPEAVQASTEFSELCPESAVVMRRRL